jgi:hypothetical protein
MTPSAEFELDRLFDLFFTSLSTIKEIADLLGADEAELHSRRFLLGLNGRCTILCSHSALIKPFRDAERAGIARIVLDRLDSLLELNSFPARKTSEFSSFQGLRAINELWASYGKNEKLCQLQRIKSCLHFGSPKEQLDFLADLKKCEDSFMLEFSEDDMCSHDKFPLWKQRSEPSRASLFAARSLFHVLETSGRCSCHTYGARLGIKTHRASDVSEEYDFNLFLEIDQRWQEAHFLAARNPQSSAKRVVEGSSKSGERKILASGRKRVEFLCDPIKKNMEKFSDISTQVLD